MRSFKLLKYISLGISTLLVFSVFYIIFNFTKNLNTIQFIIINGLSITVLYFTFNYLSSTIYRISSGFILKNRWNEPVSNFSNYLELTITNDGLVENIRKYLEIEAGFLVILEERGKVIYKTPSRLLENETVVRNIISIEKPEGIKFITYDQLFSDKPKYEVGVSITSDDITIYIVSKYFPLVNKGIIESIYDRLKDFVARRNIVEKMFEVSALTHEWELLSQVQRFFLPEKIPEIEGLDVSVFFKPLVNVSGDYYYILPTGDGKEYLFAIGDVSGKGLNASLLMAVIVNAIKINKENSLKELVYEVDRVIKDLEFEGKYTTLFVGRYHTENSTIEFINCAMPKPMLVRDNEIKTFPPNLPILGIIDLPEYESTKIQLKENDILLIASDGLVEARNSQNVEYQNTDRLEKILLESSKLSSSEIANNINQDIQNFTLNSKQTDDITYILIKRR
ncbi:MAG: PP2C family protein-serine/threonine phosphatase [Brevinematia bacterium]